MKKEAREKREGRTETIPGSKGHLRKENRRQTIGENNLVQGEPEEKVGN